MRLRVLAVLLITSVTVVAAQSDEALEAAKAQIPTLLENFTYKYKVDHFAHRPISTGGTVMLGDSLTDLGGWNEYFPEELMITRGISGDTTLGIINRVDQVTALKPNKIFVLAGTNDLYWGSSPADIFGRYRQLLDCLASGAPQAKLFIQTVPPYLELPGGDYGYLDNDRVRELNALLVNEADNRGITIIDLYSIVAKDGAMDAEKTTDGIHLNGTAYLEWASILEPYIED